MPQWFLVVTAGVKIFIFIVSFFKTQDFFQDILISCIAPVQLRCSMLVLVRMVITVQVNNYVTPAPSARQPSCQVGLVCQARTESRFSFSSVQILFFFPFKLEDKCRAEEVISITSKFLKRLSLCMEYPAL